MWSHLLKYELKKSLADKFLWIQTIMIIGFSTTALGIGYKWFKFNTQTIHKIQETEKEQWAVFKQDAALYHERFDTVKMASPNHPVTMYYAKRGYTFKIPDPLSIFNIGQGDIYPHYSMFTGVEPQKLLIDEELLNPLNQLIGKIDLSFFIIYILPLLVIAWTFDLFSNEKELGTLRLLYIQQISVEKVVVGKLIFRFVYLTTLLTAIILAAYFYIDEFDYHHLKGTLQYLIIVIFYLSIWFSLAFLVNSFGKSSAFNGMMLIGLWVVFLFLIPSVLNICINGVYPTPERKQHIVEGRMVKQNLDKNLALSSFLKIHPQYQVGAGSQGLDKHVIPVDWYPGYLATQRELNELRRRQDNEIFHRLNQQHEALDRFLFLSPALICQTTMNKLAKTDFESFYHFFEATKSFRSSWQKRIYDKLFGWGYFTQQDFEAFGTFQWVPKEMNSNFGFRLSGGFSLVLLFFTIGFMNFRKFTFQWI